MEKRKNVEVRTKLFNAALKRLDERGVLPSNAELKEFLGINTVSTISEIKGERQNIQPAAWKKFKTKYSELISELEEERQILNEEERPLIKELKTEKPDLDKVILIAQTFTESLRELSQTMSNQNNLMSRQLSIIEKLLDNNNSGNLNAPASSM